MGANCKRRLSAERGQIITMMVMAMKTMMVIAMAIMMLMIVMIIMMLMIGCKVQMAVICGERSDAAAGFLRS